MAFHFHTTILVVVAAALEVAGQPDHRTVNGFIDLLKKRVENAPLHYKLPDALQNSQKGELKLTNLDFGIKLKYRSHNETIITVGFLTRTVANYEIIGDLGVATSGGQFDAGMNIELRIEYVFGKSYPQQWDLAKIVNEKVKHEKTEFVLRTGGQVDASLTGVANRHLETAYYNLLSTILAKVADEFNWNDNYLQASDW